MINALVVKQDVYQQINSPETGGNLRQRPAEEFHAQEEGNVQNHDRRNKMIIRRIQKKITKIFLRYLENSAEPE